MIEQDVPVIKEYLQQRDVQERIQKSMQEARAKATVTISQAAKLFDLTESQLRDWEKRGLLSTERSLSTEESKGHRQFSPDVLNKLAKQTSDRKSTRLNSSHRTISYAVFCLKKKKKKKKKNTTKY